jgi:hypothetical protein
MAGPSLPERIRRLLASHLDPQAAGAESGPRRIRRPEADPDRINEAEAVLAGLGGEVWAGDVVEVETSDPQFWNARSFSLSFRIEAVGRAEIADQTGRFSFSLFFLAPHQGADVLFLEGDLPQTARAYLGTRGPDALVDELRRCRHEYLRSPEPEVTFTIQTDDLGAWTAYAAREQGRFWALHGRSDLIPQTAYAPDGVPYRDCSLYFGPSLGEATWVLRLVEIGGFGHAFQAEALPLDKIRFWRRQRPGR